MLAEGVVDLAAERDRGGLGEVLGVEAAVDLLRFVFDRAGMRIAQPGNGVLDATTLVDEKLAEMCGVDRAQRLSFLARPPKAAELRRRSINAGPMPVSSTIFSRVP